MWKLGDIVHSTPVSVSKPPDNYHIIYSDESYQAYYDAFKDRETVIYVGSNDGMLHAFTSWQYTDSGVSRYFARPSEASDTENSGPTSPRASCPISNGCPRRITPTSTTWI
ncbi:MAG: hypothetical protein JRJ83_18515 [Deltaproteobacteria bacterium]|nr:hypothetical protein [Deltaproteobacteria bacterium]